MTPNVDCGIYESREIERAFLRLMGNAHLLGNNHLDEGRRERVFNPTKGILMTFNVVHVGVTKGNTRQMLQARQESDQGDQPQDGKVRHLFGFRNPVGILISQGRIGVMDIPIPGGRIVFSHSNKKENEGLRNLEKGRCSTPIGQVLGNRIEIENLRGNLPFGFS